MKNQIIETIVSIAAAFTLAGCVHTPSTTAQKVTKQQVAINIAGDGALSVADEQCTLSQLAAKLTQLAAEPPTAVVIRTDVDVPFGQLVAVVDACKNAGVQVSCVIAKR